MDHQLEAYYVDGRRLHVSLNLGIAGLSNGLFYIGLSYDIRNVRVEITRDETDFSNGLLEINNYIESNFRTAVEVEEGASLSSYPLVST